MVQRCILYVWHLRFTHFVDVFIRNVVNLREVWDNEGIDFKRNRLMKLIELIPSRQGFIDKEDVHLVWLTVCYILGISILYMFST